MTDITAIGPDGTRHVFPAGTSQEVIDRVMRQNIQASRRQRAAAGSAARDHAERTGRRSLWERFTDNVEDVWNTSALAENYRAGRLEAVQAASGQMTDEQLRAMEARGGMREIGQVIGSIQYRLNPDGTAADARADIVNERQRRADYAAVNDRQQGNDSFLSYAREGDVGGTLAHGTVALLGTMTGALADPFSYISAGRTVLAKALTQAGVAAGADALAQDASVTSGVQDTFDWARNGMSALTGAGFTIGGDVLARGSRYVTDRFFRQPEADARADLDVADELLQPPLTEVDIEPSAPLRALPAPAQIADEGIEVEVVATGEVVDVRRTPEDTSLPARRDPEARSGDPEGEPQGDGVGGWDDVDWGRRRSPERAKAALDHLEALRKSIKPEAVRDFIRLLDEGVPEDGDARYINKDWIDWRKLDANPEELVNLSNAFGSAFADLFTKAGVGPQAWAVTRRKVKQFGHTLSDFQKTHADVTGEGGLARKSIAMMEMFEAGIDDAATRIRAIRDAARNGNPPSAATIRELAEATQRVAIMGAEEAAVGGEMARALNARKMRRTPTAMVNDLQAAFSELDEAMNGSGKMSDPEVMDKVLSDLLDGFDKKGPAGFNARFRKMRKMGVMDYIGYTAVANLLSGLMTHFKNLFGTPTHSTLDLAARFVAATTVAPIRRTLLGSAAKNTSSVTVREGVAYMQGGISALGEAMGLGFEAFKKGAPVADRASAVMTETDFVPFAYSKERLAKWVKDGIGPGDLADMAGVAFFEILRTFGFRPSVASDEFFKAIARRAELHAFAIREASYQSAKVGPKDAQKTFEAIHQSILNEPTDAALAEAKAMFGFGGKDRKARYAIGSPEFEMQNVLRAVDARQAAIEHSQLVSYQTTLDGQVIPKLEQFLRAWPLFKHFSANFVRTPTQIFKAAFRDYNPVTAPFVIALEATTPLGRQRHKAFFDALRGDEEALAGGGAAAEMVIARQVVGAAVLSAMWGIWTQGYIVGADVPEGDEYAGVLPFSVKLPGVGWVQYTGYSPLAEHIGLVADVGQIFRTKELTDEDEFNLMGALAVAVRGNVFNKSFLKGMSDFMDVIQGGKYQSNDTDNTARGMSDGAASLILGRVIPLASFMRRWAAASDTDPDGRAITRDARTWAEQFASYLPGIRESLAIKRDFMGRPVLKGPGEVGVFQVANVSRPKTDPLEVELANLANNPRVNMVISRTPTVLDGQRLTAEEHNRLIEIQGQLYRNPRNGRNMEEALRHLITTPVYTDADPSYRETLISRVISDYREDGKKAAFNPDSDHYMRDLVERTSPRRLAGLARTRGWDASTAMRERGRSYGLTPEDTEALREALNETR
jgi:hypothetical protein